MKKHVIKTALMLLLVFAMVIPSLPVMAVEGESAVSDSFTADTIATIDMTDTADAPESQIFTITTVDDLERFMALTYNFYGDTIQLGADIVWNDVEKSSDLADSTDAKVWAGYANGGYSSQFSGTLDGQGHTIFGLYMKTNLQNDFGFFRRTQNATIKNISFEKGYFTTTNTEGNKMGFVVGSTTGSITFENVYVDAIQIHSSETDNAAIGGICGYLASATHTFTNCTVYGEITAEDATVVGGLAGRILPGSATQTSVSNCINYANVTASSHAAGLIGRLQGAGTFTNCVTFGNVTGGLAARLAFLFYYNPTVETEKINVAFENCYNYALPDSADAIRYPVVVPKASGAFVVTVRGNKSVENNSVTCDSAALTPQWELSWAKEINTLFTNVGNAFTFTETDTSDLLKLEGVQLRTTTEGNSVTGQSAAANKFDIRFVSLIDFNGDTTEATSALTETDIKEIGFEAVKFSEFAASYKSGDPIVCEAVYTSIQSNYGMTTLEAAEGNYYATLVLTECPTGGSTTSTGDDVQTILVRSYCKTADATYYSIYSVFTFIGGRFAGSAAVN